MGELISSAEARIPEVEGCSDPANESSSPTASIFQRKIEFHPARKPSNGFSNAQRGDFKIETLNPGPDPKRLPGAGMAQASTGRRKVDGSDFLKAGLDPELSFRMTFRKIGAGLENLGNTCFLNSVLQCLTYTEPLAAYLQSGKHQNSCRIAGFCVLCAIQKHVSRALQSTGRILAPKDLVSNLRCISRNFRNCRQEDAHEYMVNLLESMHKCCLPSGVPSESPTAYEKSLVHKIFGGRLRSQVKCLQCSHCSNTYDPFLDLSLEIFKADSLHKALANFTAQELLDSGERQYQCQRCKQKVRARKQLTVDKAPYVLTIHLKRFRAHDPGQKIDKKVHFGPTLDMKPFVSGSYEGDLKYTLYGVLVHYGLSTHSGHYYCYVRTSGGMWYSLDDNRVFQVSERAVLEQKAYMLFYVRDRTNMVPRKPVDIVQKENSRATLGGNKICSTFNQNPKEHVQNGQNENIHDPGSAALNQKEMVSVGELKRTHAKDEASSQQNDGQVVTNCSTPIQKNPSQAQSPVKPINENRDLAALSAKRNDGTSGAKVSDCNEIRRFDRDFGVSVNKSSNSSTCQTIATNKIVEEGTSHKMNLVSDVGDSSIVPSGDSSDKADGIQDKASSGDSSDKIFEKADAVKCPMKKPCCEKNQAREASNDNGTDNSPSEKGHDNDEKMAELSTISGIPNGFLEIRATDCASQRKSKRKLLRCQVKGLHHIGLKFFRGSLGLRKKKHKRSKHHKFDRLNLSTELLLDKDCLSTDLGPSTSEKSSRITFASSSSRRKKAANNTDKMNVGNVNVCSVMTAIEREFKERICQNGSVLATDQQVKSSDSISEAHLHHARQTYCPKNSKLDASQARMIQLPSQGLDETPVGRWDDLDMPTPTLETDSSVGITIGYIGDEWDEEYDQGKRKKLRRHRHEFGGRNPFQEVASRKLHFKNARRAFKKTKKHRSSSFRI
ncbi:hypothetical protein SLEP1_g1641 [Rubroshorea leprosula]|uniref:Ubiquitin carboxyl-terminal hydrolase n=1 Tax=Rubroshorea leprosula TaxID=152421 RepID=A0AAV5HEE7_9ROSI|nr:hypothetical protein SLEP1_g1641 [Rubroshorea leprosula]